jgi:ATP-binding cassette subfamily C protein LapB
MTQDRLRWAISTFALLEGQVVDRAALHALGERLADNTDIPTLQKACAPLLTRTLRLCHHAERSDLPAIAYAEGHGWGVLIDQQPDQLWVFRQAEQQYALPLTELNLPWLGLEPQLDVAAAKPVSFIGLLHRAIWQQKSVFFQSILASLFIGLLTLGISLFSMQVYDRVIPTKGLATLATLATGVLFLIVLELLIKISRSHIMDAVVVSVDTLLSKQVYQQLLGIRIDQLPKSVGSLASQLRGYEQVRSFYTSTTLFTIVDLPLGIMFLLLITVIGSPLLAVIPALAALIALTVGWLSRRKIEQYTLESAQFNNLKTGLLVETVEGIETIKSGGGNWKFLSRWIQNNQKTIGTDLKTRHLNDGVNYTSQTLQQLSYAGLVALGAVLVVQGQMSMGGLIACSILSSRVLMPVMSLPSLLVQHSHAKAAIKGLDGLYALEQDQPVGTKPLIPYRLQGHYHLKDARFEYTKELAAVEVEELQINAGDRIGIIGPIGSGKSTLLKMLAGLYRPMQGKVLLDGMDLSQISPQVLVQHIGYLQQDHRLFAGTLRENLLIGLPDPGDDVLHDVASRTGLARVVAAHPQGFDLPIHEGGKGLSGGQRQLVAFTRILLMKPKILLLDEPTASMDEQQERQCLQALIDQIDHTATLILVTPQARLAQSSSTLDCGGRAARRAARASRQGARTFGNPTSDFGVEIGR